MEKVIRKPEYVKKTSEGNKIAVKRIKDKIWNVVYEEKEKLIMVITAYYK